MNTDKNKKGFRRIGLFLFGVYMVMLCYFMFFADSMGRTYADRAYHYNLIPFKEIGRFWVYRKSLPLESVLLNLLGNVAAFVPFGVFLPILFQRCRKFPFTVLLSFEFSLSVEVLQLIGKVGCFDVDDIILNTTGGILGFCCYFLTAWFWRRKHEKKKKE